MSDNTTAPDPTAVLVRRAFAYLIDSVIYGAIGGAAFYLLSDSGPLPADQALDRVGTLDDGTRYAFQGDTLYTISDSDAAVAAAIAGAAVLFFSVILQGLTGRTPGKLLTGIRTVRADGRNPGIFKAFVRQLLWVIDGIPGLPLVGAFFTLVTTGRRRLGDLVARTYVVRSKYAGSPIIHPDDEDDDDGGMDWTGDEADDRPVVGDDHTLGDDDPASPAPSAVEEPASSGEAVPTGGLFSGAVTDDREVTESAWAPEPEVVEAKPAGADTDAGATDDGDEGGSIPATPDEATTSGNEPTEPQWDPDRKAYISYDPRRGGWVQHDTETGEWGPISRA